MQWKYLVVLLAMLLGFASAMPSIIKENPGLIIITDIVLMKNDMETSAPSPTGNKQSFLLDDITSI